MFPGFHLWFYDRGRLERVEILSLGVGVRVKEGDEEGDFSHPTPPPFPWLASTSMLLNWLFNMAVLTKWFWEQNNSCLNEKASNTGLNNDKKILFK